MKPTPFSRSITLLLGGALATTLAGTALAQQNAIVVPPMPKEVVGLGDPDAACVMGSIDSYARIKTGAKVENEAKLSELLEMPLREVAFYAGKLTTRFAQPVAEQNVNTASRGYFDKTGLPDATPTVVWCFRSYIDATGAKFAERLDKILGLIKDKKPAEQPPIDPESLDRNALCFVLVSHAIPATQNAAKTNPAAARGVLDLTRSQHFYIGRMLSMPDQASVDSLLAKAFLFSAQLEQNRDDSTARKYGTACIETYKTTTSTLLNAAKADWKPAR